MRTFWLVASLVSTVVWCALAVGEERRRENNPAFSPYSTHKLQHLETECHVEPLQTQSIATAQQGESTTKKKASPAPNGEVDDVKDRDGVSQLDLSDHVGWKTTLERVMFSAQFVTGKDIVVLDSLFPDKPLTEKEGRSDVDLYLVIRVETRERLSYFMGPLTVQMIADDDWPFGAEVAIPDPVTIPGMGSREGVVYFVKHLWGPSQGSKLKFNRVLTRKKWKFRVIEARFK